MVHLGLDLLPAVGFEARDIDLAIEVADVAYDGLVLHGGHVVVGDDFAVPRGSDEEIGLVRRPVHGDDAITFHGGLQGADGVYFRDPDLGRESFQGLAAALADVAVAADHGHLARNHYVRGPLDPVHQGFAAAIEIVELALGDAVVDVDGGELQFAPLVHLVEPVDAGGGLLSDALDGRELPGIPARI